MTLYRYTFPIPNYTNDGVFEQHVYVEAECCPTEEKMRDMLITHRDKWDNYPDEWKCGCNNPWFECLNCIGKMEHFPRVGRHLVATNSFCKTKWGRQPISVKVIEPWSIDNTSKGDVSSRFFGKKLNNRKDVKNE